MQNEDGFVEDESLDQDGFVADEEISAAKPISKLESALAGTEQGLTLSTADEGGAMLGAFLQGPSEVASGMAQLKADLDTQEAMKQKGINYDPFIQTEPTPIGQKDQGPKSIEALYNEYLQFNREKYKNAEQANPNSYLTGQFAGGALTPMGLVGNTGKGTMTIGRGAARSALSQGATKEAARAAAQSAVRNNIIKQSAKTGSVIGGINSAGMSEAPIMSGEFAGDVGTGVVGGGVLGAALPLGIQKISDGVNKHGPGIVDGTMSAVESVFGPLRSAREIGKNVGQVISKKGADRFHDEIAQAAGKTAKTFKADVNRMASIKKAIEDEASNRGITLDENDINSIISKIEDFQLESNLPKASSDLKKLQDLVFNLKNGKAVRKTVRNEQPSQIEKFRLYRPAGIACKSSHHLTEYHLWQWLRHGFV